MPLQPASGGVARARANARMSEREKERRVAKGGVGVATPVESVAIRPQRAVQPSSISEGKKTNGEKTNSGLHCRPSISYRVSGLLSDTLLPEGSDENSRNHVNTEILRE